MNITYNDKMKTFQIEKGEEIIIELKHNAMAGYLWQTPMYDYRILDLKDFVMIADPLLLNNVGASSTQRISFIGRAIGKSSIFLQLRRSFEIMSIDSFSVYIEVV